MIDVKAILSKIHYIDWKFEYKTITASNWNDNEPNETVHIIRVKFEALDNDTMFHEATIQHGRWWVIPNNFTESDVIRTAWKAVECAVLHEAQEQFYYNGHRVMDPHRNLTIKVENI